ncbi:unnamed protein product [Allacma fusca]|uniref:Uncharacterized protein n=1 Tax=Allacma fusca TaxID=39272 RepID=A0A8J2LI20_9HEXA|nr:unnamed protein product [Allacma fusca]
MDPKAVDLEGDKSDDGIDCDPRKRRRSNPKKDLIVFLEKKSEKEGELRKEEMRIREIEANNKKMELEILRLKAEAEIDERKKITQLLVKLASRE